MGAKSNFYAEKLASILIKPKALTNPKIFKPKYYIGQVVTR